MPAAPARLLLTTALVGSLAFTALPATAVAEPAAPETTAPSTGTAAKGPGAWQVSKAGDGAWRITWRSPQRLPVTSDRATISSAGVPIGTPTLESDGRTVVTTVLSETRPDPATLDVMLSGDRLDEPGVDETGTLAPSAGLPPTSVLDVEPSAPGPYEVVTSDYELPGVKLPRMKEPIEMVGHVVEPAASADTGPRPLVLFLHGRHSFCYDPDDSGMDGWEWPCQEPFEEIPSHLGYDYIQQVLASQGFATVSVRVNGINAQDYRLSDGGADARAQIVQRHLDHWASMAAGHQLDLDQVVLVGHSRGGEGVNRASIQIPLDAPYRIAGQVLLAPTDFGTQTAPYVPTVTVLPYCDGDVYDLQGQRFTDSARDLTDDDTSLKSSVLVMGANHNFFNTEWTPGIAQALSWDDWGGNRGLCGAKSATRLSAADQRSVGVAYVAGAVQLFTDGAEEFLPMFDGSVVHPPSIGAADVRSHAIGGGREERRPAIDTGLSLPQGAETSFCQGVLSESSPGACGRGGWDLWGNVPHWYDASEPAPPRRALELSWTEAGQSGGLVFDDPLDLSSGRLELRSIVDPVLGDVRIRLRLTDADGASAVVVPDGEGIVRALPVDRRVGKRWAQAVIADPSAAPGLDLARITQLDVIGDSTDGRLWILDVASAPTTLPAVPEKRLPTVSLGTLTLQEGDEEGVQSARVPFTITGEVTRPATLTVAVQRQDVRRGSKSRLRVDLAPGQTEGYLRFEYVGNTVDDFPKLTTQYFAFPVSGVMTDVYDGSVTVLDDDPSPTAQVRIPRKVREGQPVVVTARLDGARSYDSYLSVHPVRAQGRALTAGDVPAAWLEKQFVEPASPRQPLSRLGLYLYTPIRPDERAGQITIPTRTDGVDEGTERLKLRIQLDRQRFVRTVKVVD